MLAIAAPTRRGLGPMTINPAVNFAVQGRPSKWSERALLRCHILWAVHRWRSVLDGVVISAPLFPTCEQAPKFDPRRLLRDQDIRVADRRQDPTPIHTRCRQWPSGSYQRVRD